ncbi:hypothetical protein LguiA_010338 [Lonicera macranthoides]
MGTRIDFLKWLETDVSMDIMTCLDDPSDLVRVSSVSKFWRHFVITHGFCKQLCLRMFPQVADIADVTEQSCRMEKSVDVGCSKSTEWENLEQDHRVYASLSRALTAFKLSVCIVDAVSASSTDNYPRESIVNTVGPEVPQIGRRTLYWSSKGHRDPQVPETLIYRLRADFCVISEIDIQPFQAYFQSGFPIYSAKSVRFRMGHPKCPSDIGRDLLHLPLQQWADGKFVWTYTSQEFPMAQENRLQRFKLPEPVICMGGFLQIELLGRVQRQEMDNLFYICVSHVQVVGQSLCPAFCVDVLDSPRGKFLLKYDSEAFRCRLQQGQGQGDGSSDTAASDALDYPQVEERMQGQLEDLLELLMHGIDPGIEPPEWDDEEDHAL